MKVRRLIDLDRNKHSRKSCTPFSRGEDPKIFRSRKPKPCYCGFHSAKNVKKNLHHHSTLMRFSIRLLRKHTDKSF